MHWVFGNYVRGRGAAGLLIVRLVFGLGIMLHGWQKINSPGGPMGWMGEKAPVPAVFQGLATAAEFSGGLGILVGLLTPIAAFGLTCNMLVALCMVHLPKGDPFVGKGGYESAAGYLAVALLVLLTGPGAWSLDALWVGMLFPRGKSAEN